MQVSTKLDYNNKTQQKKTLNSVYHVWAALYIFAFVFLNPQVAGYSFKQT